MAAWDPRANEIFLQILEIACPEQRQARLAVACGEDKELRGAVERLLRAHEAADAFLGRPAVEEALTGTFTPHTEGAGTRIGPYKLLQKLGEGGMGTVWMAEQTVPVQRRVALKIIKAGMDSANVLARFLAERQALALMDHPHIARILDAGTTENDRPYFVMELVKGVPLTRYCDQEQLTARQRLELFIPVCQAVQHAHIKGIIHRDLKPSNILVALYDGQPVPKVIDFGVAKATGGQLTQCTLFTEVGQIVGTLEYMAPEQAELNNLDIDTRVDIYALGVILYELLTGGPPFTGQQLRGAGFAEMLRLIREVEPPKPSSRLSSSQELPAIAARRKLEPKGLTRLVHGDLDWIVMKCLRKERGRRYETAEGLAQELRRYLADEPVQAGPPGAGYRLRKFVRRNQGPVLAATAVLLALLAGIAGTTWGLVEARRQRDDAEQARGDEAEQRERAETAEEDARAGEARANTARDDSERMARKERAARLQAEAVRHALQINMAMRAWEQHDVAQAEHILDGLVGSFRQTWEARHLRDLCRRKALPLQGDKMGPVTLMAISADGKKIVSVGVGRVIHVWETSTGKELFCLQGHDNYVTSVAFSLDGKRIVSGSWDGTVRVWDPIAGKQVLCIEELSNGVNSVAFSADGKRIVSGGGSSVEPGETTPPGELKVWDAATGKELLSLKGHAASVNKVAISSDGRHIVSGSADGTVRVWDGVNGKDLLSLKGHKGYIITVALSPDGTRIVSCDSEKEIKVWDALTGQEKLALKGHTSYLYSVAFSPDGRRIFSSSQDKTVQAWDAVTGQELFCLRGHTDVVSAVCFSANGKRIVTGSKDRTVREWDVDTPQEKFTLRGHQGQVWSAAISADGRHIVSCGGGTVKIWNAVTGKEIRSLAETAGTVYRIAISKDGRIATAGGDRMVRVWDMVSGRELVTMKGHTLHVHTVAFSHDGSRIVSWGEDKVVRLWDSRTGQELRSFPGYTNALFSPDGQRVIGSSDDKKVTVWDVATGKELLSLAPETDLTYCVALSADGKMIAAGGRDGEVTVWDALTGKERRTFKGQPAPVRALAFSPDGRRIITGGGEQGHPSDLTLWDETTGQELLALKGHKDAVFSVVFSADGMRIVSAGDDHTVKVWDAPPPNQKLR